MIKLYDWVMNIENTIHKTNRWWSMEEFRDKKEGEWKKIEDRRRGRLMDTYYNKYESQEGRKDILQIKISYLHEWIFL